MCLLICILNTCCSHVQSVLSTDGLSQVVCYINDSPWEGCGGNEIVWIWTEPSQRIITTSMGRTHVCDCVCSCTCKNTHTALCIHVMWIKTHTHCITVWRVISKTFFSWFSGTPLHLVNNHAYKLANFRPWIMLWRPNHKKVVDTRIHCTTVHVLPTIQYCIYRFPFAVTIANDPFNVPGLHLCII